MVRGRGRGTRVLILVEDRALERFAREALLKFGFHPRELRVSTYPVGRGSAKQWVETQYPLELKRYRKNANHQSIAVLVGTEADELSVSQRRQQLEKVLQNEGLQARGLQERIVLWIPKWNVETWILHLSGQVVTENQKIHKIQVSTIDFRAVAAEFLKEFQVFKSAQEIDSLPSLETAYEETRRFDF